MNREISEGSKARSCVLKIKAMATDSYLLPYPYSKNTTLRSADIGKAIGRSRQTVDSYIADLRAATQLGLDIKIPRMTASVSPRIESQRDWTCPNRQYLTIYRKCQHWQIR